MKLPGPLSQEYVKFTSFKHKQRNDFCQVSYKGQVITIFLKRQKGRIKSFQRNIITKSVNTVSNKNISKQDKRK